MDSPRKSRIGRVKLAAGGVVSHGPLGSVKDALGSGKDKLRAREDVHSPTGESAVILYHSVSS